MKRLFLSLICLWLIGTGCIKSTPEQKPCNLAVEGQVYENKDKGFFIKLYPEYKKVSEYQNNAVCFADAKITRFATIFWERDVGAVQSEYKKAFKNPENFQDAASLLALEELGVLGKIITVEKLTIKDVDAYYFQTKHKRFLTDFYRTRIEAFPKNKNLQITVFFQNEKKDLPGVAKMIEGMRIIPGIKPVPEEDIHHH
ncbi:MAG: hypothetical protein QME42_05245 [bacterium]|nr:hypothetical protein [bacterium]